MHVVLLMSVQSRKSIKNKHIPKLPRGCVGLLKSHLMTSGDNINKSGLLVQTDATSQPTCSRWPARRALLSWC